MKRNLSETGIPVSPAKQLAAFIAKFDPAIAKLVRLARGIVDRILIFNCLKAIARSGEDRNGRFKHLERLLPVLFLLVPYPYGPGFHCIAHQLSLLPPLRCNEIIGLSLCSSATISTFKTSSLCA